MKQTIQNLKRIYSYGREYKKNLILFIIISIGVIAINLLFPILTARELLMLSSSLYKELLTVTLMIFGMCLLSDITSILLKKNAQKFFRGTTKKLQMASAREILKIELSSIDKEGSGIFIQRLTNDVEEIPKIFIRGIENLTGIFTSIGIFVAVFIINKMVFFYFLIASSILLMLYLLRMKKMDEEDKIYRKQQEKNHSLVSELVRGIRDIKMLYAKESFLEEMDKSIETLSNSQFNFRNVEMRQNFYIEVVFDCCEVLLIVLIVYLMSHQLLSVASALILYSYKSRIFDHMLYYMGNLIEEVRNFNLSSSRILSIIDNRVFKKEKFGRQSIKEIKGNFEFQDVYFKYEKQEVLKGLSFKVKENETVAFVGKSGVGKSTIFSLLCKLYDVSSGNILIDGKNIKTLDEQSIRDNITIISQNPYIFNMSIKDNLRLVKKDVSDEDIKKACEAACLDEFLESLPNGYETIVGEGGITLSGGQRQRLAIARALVQNTKIILFDEATSALDNETQNKIQEAILHMKNKYTILMIAHRLSTIVHADKIMLIEDGKVTASGTHQKLLSKNKSYQHLYENELLQNEKAIQ